MLNNIRNFSACCFNRNFRARNNSQGGRVAWDWTQQPVAGQAIGIFNFSPAQRALPGYTTRTF